MLLRVLLLLHARSSRAGGSVAVGRRCSCRPLRVRRPGRPGRGSARPPRCSWAVAVRSAAAAGRCRVMNCIAALRRWAARSGRAAPVPCSAPVSACVRAEFSALISRPSAICSVRKKPSTAIIVAEITSVVPTTRSCSDRCQRCLTFAMTRCSKRSRDRIGDRQPVRQPADEPAHPLLAAQRHLPGLAHVPVARGRGSTGACLAGARGYAARRHGAARPAVRAPSRVGVNRRPLHPPISQVPPCSPRRAPSRRSPGAPGPARSWPGAAARARSPAACPPRAGSPRPARAAPRG